MKLSHWITWLLHPKNKWARFFRLLNIGLTVAVVFLNIKVDRLEEDNIRQRIKIDLQSGQIADLKSELLQKTIAGYEFNALVQSSDDSPVPQWSKKVVNGKYIMRYFNKAYADVFLIPRGIDPYSYIGNEDYVAWDSVLVKEFHRRDSLVFATKRPFRGTIMLPDSIGNLEKWNVNKYPVFYDGEPIFISGLAYKPGMK